MPSTLIGGEICFSLLNHKSKITNHRSKILTFLLILVFTLPAAAFDFVQERNTIPVSFDGIECQVPWTTGYDYVQPTFCDIDGDSDLDLFFGSGWRRLSFYENIGTSQDHDYQFGTNLFVDLQGIVPGSQTPNKPSFCDIDNDGDFDLFVGCYYGNPIFEGRFLFYRNEGTSLNPEFVFIEELFQDIESPSNGKPVWVDIDNDQDMDLFIGFGYPLTNYMGRIYFYRNEGDPDSASMILESNFFLNIDLGEECLPEFCDIDADGDFDMFLGDADGHIWYYRNNGSPEVYSFAMESSSYGDIYVGKNASPTFCDIDADADYDLFVGERSWGGDNRHGDIDFYRNIGTADSARYELVTQNFATMDIGRRPSPALVDLDNDNDLDMLFGDVDGNLNYFSNSGSISNPAFVFETDNFQGITANYQSRPCLGDLDSDGDYDMAVGKTSWTTNVVVFFINNGTPEIPQYVQVSSLAINIGEDWPKPELVDIDNDGDLDLFVGHQENQLMYYENIGSPQIPDFTLADSNYFNTPYTGSEPFFVCFGDLDEDGDYDMLRGRAAYIGTSENSYLDFYRNNGTAENPNLSLEESHFCDISLNKCAEPFLADIDNDGDLDLFIGDTCGGVSFWRNNTVTVSDNSFLQPYTFSLQQNYPNPFNASTTIPFTLDRAGKVTLNIYNIAGQRAFSLETRISQLGTHKVTWNAEGMASGIYLVRLTADGGLVAGRKIVLVK